MGCSETAKNKEKFINKISNLKCTKFKSNIKILDIKNSNIETARLFRKKTRVRS
jgi:hypothetical protein